MIPEIVDSVFPHDLSRSTPSQARTVVQALQAIHEQLVVNAALLRELIGWAAASQFDN